MWESGLTTVWLKWDPPVLPYFDPKEGAILQMDTSMNSVGAVQIQKGNPVCYASCAFIPMECKYQTIV